MKYLSSKPFTGGVNSKAFVDRWEDTFGKPHPCDEDGDVSEAKDRIPFTEIDRQNTMSRLEQRLRQSHFFFECPALDKMPLSPLRLYLDAPDTFEGFFRRLFMPWVKNADTILCEIKMIGRVPASQVRAECALTTEQFLGLFPKTNLCARPRPKFE